ncbi:MAG: RiPP maturation radical SAM C-methyltransferase, partial [Candidatus Xenobia bacterium]
MPRVALVSMPFNSTSGPSLQCGLLAAVLKQQGMEADTLHLNLELARMMGLRPYERLADVMLPQLGEWMASYAVFGDELPPDDGFLKEFATDIMAQARDSGMDEPGFVAVRRELFPRFLDWCMENVAWEKYDVVGFSSTFQQQLASLAMARRIKHKHPHIQIVIGGSNVLDPMGREHIKAWPWV